MSVLDCLKYVVGCGCIVKYGKKESVFEAKGLPKGWTVAHLNEIGTIITGNTPSKKKACFYGKHTPFFKPADLNSAYYVTRSTDALSKQGLKKARLIPKRSVMITSIGTIGKVGFNRIDGATNQQINSIIPHSGIMWPEYLYFVCISPQFQKLLLTNASSTTLPIINKSRFSQLKIPLPPLAEQRRIVHKIESIFAQIDACRSKLEKLVSQTQSAQGSLAQLKNSILKQAFEGKLVPQNPNDEPVKTLLKQFYKKSDNNLESENEWLPKRWTVAHLNEIGTIITGNTPSKKKAYFYGKHTPFFKPTDLNSAYYVTRSTDALSKQGLKKARLIPKRSVMITSIGATIGKVGFNRIDGATNQQINSIIPHSGIMWPEYLYFVCISPQFQKLLLTNASSTTLPIINKSRFSQLKIPLPPLAEQRRIVHKIESIFAKIDAKQKEIEKIEQHLKSIPDSFNELKSSILKLAFEGKLVPQDPNDEPAAILLERISQEKLRSN